MNARLKNSPWGHVQEQTDLAPGIALVSTPGHGGVWLSPERVAALPAWARAVPSEYCPKPVWWEEDCEAGIPILVFYDDMPAWLRERHAPVDLLRSFQSTDYLREAAKGAWDWVARKVEVSSCE